MNFLEFGNTSYHTKFSQHTYWKNETEEWPENWTIHVTMTCKNEWFFRNDYFHVAEGDACNCDMGWGFLALNTQFFALLPAPAAVSV